MSTTETNLGRRLLGTLLVALALATGCGGGGDTDTEGGGSSSSGGEGAGGPPAVSASGAVVSQAAQNEWQQGLTAFNRWEAEGWNDSRCGAVIEEFEEAARAQRGSRFPEAVYMQGLVKLRCGDARGARRLFEQALEQAPSLCGARVGVIMMDYEANSNRAAAMAAYSQALEADGRCTQAYVNLATLQAQEQAGEEEALNNLRRALAITSDYMPAFNQMALIYYRQGLRPRNQGAFDLAEIVCRQAQLINANFAPIYNTWGLVRLARGDVNDALRYFERTIQLDGSLFEAQVNFGQITFQFRGYEDAKRAFERATQLRPRHYEATLGLGSALRGLGQIDQARQQYELAIQIDGARPEAYYNIALLYHDYMSGSVEDMQNAIRFYDQFLQRAGNNARYTEVVAEINRTCQQQQRRPGRRQLARGNCRPGRKQNAQMAIDAIREGERIQAEADRMQREVEAMERQQQQR